jgi:glycosyltransferase involved in cell wall biosynthesis
VDALPPYALVLDIQGTQNFIQLDRGIPRYIQAVSSELMQIRGLVAALTINPLLPFPSHIDPELANSPLLTWATTSELDRLSRAKPVACHVMSPFEYQRGSGENVVATYALRSRTPLIVTLYDLIPLVMAERYLGDPAMARRYRLRLGLIRNADLVLAISEYTRHEAIQLLGLDPAKVKMVGTGVSSFFTPAGPDDKPVVDLRRSVPDIARPFVVAVLGMDPRKNVERLIEAYGLLPRSVRKEHQLVIACTITRPARERWSIHAQRAGLGEDEVVFTGWIHDSVLRDLYRAARLSVFPSLYEGFGLPVAEAIACGCPTITSNLTSTPEILDWKPAEFDPTDAPDMAESIERGLSDSEFRQRLDEVARKRRASFTWTAVGGRTIDALHSLPEPRTHRRRRKRIALVGSLPPTESTIAHYHARLALRVARRCELDCFDDSDDARSAALENGARRFSARALGWTMSPAAYDAIIYSFGNRERYRATYDLFLRHPGVVWLHDARLASFYLDQAQRVPKNLRDAWLRQKMEAMYGSRLPPELGISSTPEDFSRLGVGMTRELVQGARGLIVNSSFCAQLVRLDQGPDSPMPPTRVIPFAVPEPPPENESRGPRLDDEFLLASLGAVDATKAPELMIRALALVRREIPARLAFVGRVSSPLRADLEQLADDCEVRAAIEFTGHVDDQEYWNRLRRADCALQLQVPTTGESCATVGDCLSVGMPVITNAMTYRDSPPDALRFLNGLPTSDALADHIRALLTRPQERLRLSMGARRYARSQSMSRAADALVDFVLGL